MSKKRVDAEQFNLEEARRLLLASLGLSKGHLVAAAIAVIEQRDALAREVAELRRQAGPQPGRSEAMKKGDRVELTEAGRKAGMQGRARSPCGVVTAAIPDGLYVRVRRDGVKTAARYHRCFWRVVVPAPDLDREVTELRRQRDGLAAACRAILAHECQQMPCDVCAAAARAALAACQPTD